MAATQAVLFSIWAYNRLADGWSGLSRGMDKLATTVWNYLSGVSNTWYFLTGVDTPIPASYYQNGSYGLRTPHTVKWAYDTASHTLIRHPLDMERISEIQTFSWLSAAITVGRNSFALDDWIRSFNYEQSDDMWFNPWVLAACWSIDSKIWFTPRDNAMLQIIDENGTLFSFSLAEDEFNVEQWLTCLGDEGEDDEEGEGGEGEDGGGEDEDEESEENEGDEEGDEESDEEGDEESDEEGDEEGEGEQPPVEGEQPPAEAEQPPAEAEQPPTIAPIPASPPPESVLDEID